MFLPLLVTAVIGYLLGSLPFGYLVARSKGVNIFEVGSKNPGATNVRRVLGSGPGNLVFALDAAKGALAVALGFFHVIWTSEHMAFTFDINDEASLRRPVVGLVSALVGHSFSCFTRFRGGKGVATGIGGFAVLFPYGAGIALALWGLFLLITRYVSLASMLAAASLPFSAYFLHKSWLLTGASLAIAVFVAVRHRTNISRILAGTESRIGQKKPAASTTPPPPAPTPSS